TPTPTGTPTITHTPTPSPTPTPVDPCPPLPPDESPQLINRTPGDGIISEILFNEENHYLYINARNRSWIDWVSYDDIKNTPSDTEVPFKGGRGYLGHYISISPTGKLRYVAINQKSSTDPVVGLFRCKGDGDLQILASSVTSKSALLPNWTYNFTIAGFHGFISGTRKGCVSPHPPTVYIPSDGSYVRHIPTGVPYTIYSRLFAFMNGLDVQDFHPIQAVFEPAKDESPWHLNGSSMAIGDIFYGCNKVFVPFEDLNTGRLLVGTPKSDGSIPFQTKNIDYRNTGLEEVIFYDDQGKPLTTPVNFKYSEMVFHPTENIAFIADARNSGIYLVNLNDMDTVFLRYRATKYVHPKSITINNDETRMIAITGDGQYVMCKSAYQNGYKGAIYPFKLNHDMQGLPYLEPMSAIKPVDNCTFNRVTKFAAGARTSVYVVNDTTNELWYFRISDDKDVVTTSPLKKITVPSGTLSSIYTDNNREMLAVRSVGATADGDAACFFKINNWYYKFEYLKPKRLPNSTCRFCEPMLPLGGPVEVRVKITDFSGNVISKTDADVTCYYIITGPDGTYQSEEKPMDDLGGGEFSTKIHPPHPGDIEIICKATPKGKAVSDNASLFACVSDKSAPTITCDVIPKNVIIPYWFDKPGGGRAYYVCKVKGTVQWGAGSDHPNKTVTVYETKNPLICKQVTYLNLDTENDFEVSFELMKGEFPYFDQPIEFDLTAVAEKALDTIGSGLVHFVPSPQICVVSLDKYNTTQYGKYFEIKSVLYDSYISYKWTINLPPWADKFDFTFKGKDLKILGCEIPVINEVEINFTTSLKLVHAAFSDYRPPVVCESSGGVSGGATIPYGIGKFSGQLSASVKGTGYYKPDCDLMAFPVGTPKVEISGGGKLGGEISVLTLLKKLRTLEKVAKSDVFKNLLKWLGKVLENPAYKRVLKFLEECAAVSVSLVVQCTLKGDMVADPASPIYVRLTNFSGEFRKSVEPSISISLDRWFQLTIDFIIGVVSDPTDLTFSMASISTWTPGKITSGFIIIKGGWKAGIVSGDITKTPWVEVYYPEKPSGGVAPPQLAAVPDFLRADYNLLAVKPRTRINADDTPTTVVNNIYLFSTPFQIVQGTKRMIIYLHRRPDLPFERSTEIYYLYIDNDVLMSYGPVWEDTRFQDYPTAVFTADGNVLLACQSIKIDDFTAPDPSDIIASNNASAPYQEIAWALFNTTSLQWSAPVYLTNDTKEDFEPRLFIDHKNKPILLFQTSSSDGCFYTSENTKCALKFSRFDSGNFSAPQILVDNVGVPIRLDCHGYSDKTWLVYSRDQDDDALTTPDTQLYALCYTGTPQAWDATPTQLTSGAAYNDTPRLLADEQGRVRLIWQHNNEVWSSVGEPLAQNPQVLLKGEGLSRTQVSHFIQLLNGDIASLTSGYIGDKNNPGSFIYQPFYDYVDPTTGTLGTEGAGGGGANGSMYQFLVDAVGLPNEKVSALFFQRQITYSLDDINPSLDVGTASLMLYNFLPNPPEDYKIGIAMQCPERAKPGDTVYVNLIPNRRMKIYSSDFKITVDEGLTIKDVQLAAGMGNATIALDKRSATIIRSGADPVGFFLENTTLATMTIEVAENTSASAKHIFLTDLDSMGDFMTTEGMGMKFTSEPASLDIIFPASWYVRGD
ncbi:MAG: hypothetical protein NT106_05035, partial [Candidatus Sumerlaeota bacterium]|nr:hypothetical protein [Candidatus Sumerlaeota bacterium]